MSGNAYARVRRLSSHPAFSFAGTDATPLKCPYPTCGHLFGRIPEYDRHFLSHGPTEATAYEWLSFRSFIRLFPESELLHSAPQEATK